MGGGRTGPVPLRGGCGGGVPTPGGTIGGWDPGGARPEYPLPNRPEKSAQLLGQVLRPQGAPLGRVGPGAIGGRLGGEQERQAGGALQDRRSRRGAEGVCPTHSSPGSLLAPRWGPPPSKTRGGGHVWAHSVPLSLSTTPTPPRAFSSPVGPKHRPHPPPKPSPC